MHLAILADIYGNVLALQAVLADLERRKVDEVVNLGPRRNSDWLGAAVAHRLALRRVGLDLGAIQRHVPELHQAGLLA
jgi:hypothetical protein